MQAEADEEEDKDAGAGAGNVICFGHVHVHVHWLGQAGLDFGQQSTAYFMTTRCRCRLVSCIKIWLLYLLLLL